MRYPHDDELDADTRELLAAFRASDPIPEPNTSILELVSDEMPADLAAWLHTYAHHATLVSIGDVWFEPDGCMPLPDVIDDFDDDELDGAAREGVGRFDLDDAIVMGNTADGEVFYAAAWCPGDAGLTLIRFSLAGYEDDGFRAVGGLLDGLRALAADVDAEAIDESVRDLLAE